MSHTCQDLDVVSESFLGRSLNHESFPHLWLDAMTQHVREAGRIVNVGVASTRMDPRSYTPLAVNRAVSSHAGRCSGPGDHGAGPNDLASKSG